MRKAFSSIFVAVVLWTITVTPPPLCAQSGEALEASGEIRSEAEAPNETEMLLEEDEFSEDIPVAAPEDETPREEKTEETSAKAGEEKSFLAVVNEKIFALLFFDVAFGSISIDVEKSDGTVSQQNVEVPLIIIVLALGSIFFTVFYGFINFRGFRHAIDIVRGKYDREEDAGEISHFRALTSALSATIGLGNIAGVAIAI